MKALELALIGVAMLTILVGMHWWASRIHHADHLTGLSSGKTRQ